jgi:hypothetical protein
MSLGFQAAATHMHIAVSGPGPGPLPGACGRHGIECLSCLMSARHTAAVAGGSS